MQYYTKYVESKRFFIELANRNIGEAKEILNDYKELLHRYGEFIAARYIRDIYLDFLKETSKKRVSKN